MLGKLYPLVALIYHGLMVGLLHLIKYEIARYYYICFSHHFSWLCSFI